MNGVCYEPVGLDAFLEPLAMLAPRRSRSALISGYHSAHRAFLAPRWSMAGDEGSDSRILKGPGYRRREWDRQPLGSGETPASGGSSAWRGSSRLSLASGGGRQYHTCYGFSSTHTDRAQHPTRSRIAELPPPLPHWTPDLTCLWSPCVRSSLCVCIPVTGVPSVEQQSRQQLWRQRPSAHKLPCSDSAVSRHQAGGLWSLVRQRELQRSRCECPRVEKFQGFKGLEGVQQKQDSKPRCCKIG